MATDARMQIILDATDKASKVFSTMGQKISGSIKKISRVAMVTTGAIAGIGTAGFLLGKNLTDMAGKSNQLADTLKNRLGKEFDNLLPTLKKASGGTVSEYEAMMAASKAMELGVTKDTKKMGDMMSVARVKARKMGISTEQAFDDLVTGVGRMSPLILDNLGIAIPTAAKETMKSMNDLEKKQYLTDLIIASEDLANIQQTDAEKAQELSANIADMKVEIGQGLLPVWGNMLGKLNILIKKVGPKLEEVFKNISDWFNSEGGQAVKDFVEKGIDILIVSFQTLWDIITTVYDAFVDIGDWMDDNETTVETFAVILGSIAAALLLVGAYFLIVNGALFAYNAYITISTAVTVGFGAALAFVTAPLTLIVLAIAAVIAIGYLLWKNWDSIKAKAGEVWDWIQLKIEQFSDWIKKKKDKIVDTFNGIKDALVGKAKSIGNGISDGLKNGIKGAINWVIDKINWLTSKFNGMLGGLNKVPGVNLSKIEKIPRLAKGGTIMPGQSAMVGEDAKGTGEIITASATPIHVTGQRQTAGMMGGGQTVNLTINANGSYFDDLTTSQFADKILKVLRQAGVQTN